MRRTTLFLLCLILTVSLMGGCSSDNTSVFSFDIYSVPDNFDPLFVDTSDEQLIIDNTMMGLLQFDENGEIIPGDAASYIISPDGCTYTFTLRENARWSDGTAVTAQDYVFAFRRMFDASHPAPESGKFTVIAGASELLAGGMTPLGVTAENDHTLVITLREPFDHFPELLCSSAAVPCKESFFDQTGGRYGLSKETCLFNGPFLISNIYDDVIYLASNETFWGSDQVHLSYVSLQICDEEEDDPAARYAGKQTDAAFLSSSQLEVTGTGGSHVLSSENNTWVLSFSPSGNAADPRVRAALAHAVDTSSFLTSDTASLTAARGFVPASVTLGGSCYRTAAGDILPVHNVASARENLHQALSASGSDRLPTITVLCPNDPTLLAALQEQVQIWQRDLQVYLNISTVSEAEIEAALESGDYDIALVCISSAYNDPADFLSSLMKMQRGYENETVTSLLREATLSGDPVRKVALIKQAEELITADLPCIPMFCEQSFLLYRSDFSGLFTSPSFARIFFRCVS